MAKKRVYNKTLEYVKQFAKFTTTDSASAVRECVFFRPLFFEPFHSMTCFRTLRREPLLTQFETAQIANLCPVDADEAKSIIPRCAAPSSKLIVTIRTHLYLFSLVKVDDDKLQALLDEIQTMRKFQV